ncbi:MAG: PAS domain S-box protein [Bacteroidota bacterium]
MNNHYKLENRILLKVTMYASILSAIATFTNIFIHLYVPAIVSFAGALVYFFIYRTLRSAKKTFLSNELVIITFYIYFTAIWFCNAGSNGNAILLFTVLFFTSFVTISEKKHPFFIGLSICLILMLYGIEYYFPSLIFQPYHSIADRFIDIVVIAVLIIFMVKILIDIIKASYSHERNLVELKNVELETSKKMLSDSQIFFSKLAENIPGVSFQFAMDVNGKTTFNYISGAVEEIYEISPEQVYKKRYLLFKMISKEELLLFMKGVNYSFEHLTEFSNKHKIVTPSGKEKCILTQAKPEKLSDGTVVWYGYSQDITESKKEEEKTLASESKLRFISENTSDGIVVLEEGCITYSSKSYMKMFGYSQEDQIDKTEEKILSLVHPDDKEDLLKNVENAVAKQEKNLVVEYRYLHKEGYYVWREDTVNLFYDENGKNVKDIVVARDITEQKKNRIEFEQVKSMLEQTSSIAKVGGWEVNMLTKEVIWTDLIYEIYELNEKEFKPDIFSALSPFKKGQSRGVIIDFFKNVSLTGKEYDEELELITAKGNYKWVRAIGKPIMQNKICIKIFGTIQDITIQKQKDLKIKELALVASKTTDAVIITDANSKISWVNNAFEHMTGYTLDEVIGKKQRDLLLGPDTSQEAINNILSAGASYKPVKETILNYAKNGQPIWFDVSITPVFDEKGVCTNFIDVKKDVTERMEKQKQLKALTDVTTDQNKRLLNFAYIVSHNIRSHSANLSGLVNLIEHNDNEEETETLFGMLKTSTYKLEETIQNLNEIITIQNNLNQSKTVLNLKREMEKTFSVINDTILESKVTLINNLAEDTMVEVVPAYLDSILLNLLTNAIKYRAPEREPVVTISSEQDENYIVLLVNDNGLGMDLNRLKHKLFGMYKTFHNNANARGIGLFITKNQIEAMNGKIEVESEVNVGTTFKIYFPVNNGKT